MSVTTISLDNSTGTPKTLPAPTRADIYPEPQVTPMIPLDGAMIVQRSANRGNTGDKNGVRVLEWNALPVDPSGITGVSHTMTLAELKALEGKSSDLNGGTCWDSVYVADTDIKIIRVRTKYLKDMEGTSWYEVRMEFVEE